MDDEDALAELDAELDFDPVLVAMAVDQERRLSAWIAQAETLACYWWTLRENAVSRPMAAALTILGAVELGVTTGMQLIYGGQPQQEPQHEDDD